MTLMRVCLFLVFIQTISSEESIHQKKFLSTNFLEPVSDAVSTFVNLTKHPNYGGIQFLNPLNLWQKLHEKASGYLTGPYGATFGTAHNGPLDYPFAFRNNRKRK